LARTTAISGVDHNNTGCIRTIGSGFAAQQWKKLRVQSFPPLNINMRCLTLEDLPTNEPDQQPFPPLSPFNNNKQQATSNKQQATNNKNTWQLES
jgi:hypothetical protein